MVLDTHGNQHTDHGYTDYGYYLLGVETLEQERLDAGNERERTGYMGCAEER